jgi:flagellar hook-length control protein FliK
MNDANIDHLLQVTALRANWQTPSSPVGNGDQTRFGDHLAQASTEPPAAEPAQIKDAQFTESERVTKSERANNRRSEDVDTDRSEVGAKDVSNAPSSSTESQPEDIQSGTEVSEDGATAAESNTTDSNVSADETQSSAIEKQETTKGDDDQNHDEEVTELVVAAEAVAVQRSVPTEVPQELASGDDAADTPTLDVSAKVVSKADKSKNGPQHVVQQQSIETEVGTSISEDVEPTATPPAHAEAKQAEHDSQVKPSGDVKERATSEEAELTLAGGAAKSPSDRSPTVSRPQRTADTEHQSRDGTPTAGRGEETKQSDQVAVTTGPTPKKAEKHREEPADTKLPHPATGRPSPRPNAASQDVKLPLTGAVDSAQNESVQEAAKRESTEESARPGATPAPRMDTQLHTLARFHRGNGTIARVHADARVEDGPRVDPARFVSRVAKAFHVAQERGGALQLRLSPPELGAVRLELLVHDGVLAAKLEAETPTARRALLDHLPVLRDRLAEQSIRIERFDVDLRQEGGNYTSSSPQQGQQQQSQHGSPQRPPSRQPTTIPEPSVATTRPGSPASDTQINLVA